MLKLKSLIVVSFLALLPDQFRTVVSQSSSTACSASSRPDVINNSSKGWITSPNYPNNYNNLLDCQWLIISPNADEFLSVRFTDFSTETSQDYVTIFDGDLLSNRVLAILSGYLLPGAFHTYTTTQRNLLLRFTSDGSGVYSGFNATYWLNSTVSHVACDRNLQPFSYSNDTGIVSSANYPRNYDDNMDCRWLITARLNELVRIRFTDFSTEAYKDYVYIYDGSYVSSSPLIAALTGYTYSTASYTTSQRNMLVRFTSDSSITDRGFNATFWSISAASQIACSRISQPYIFSTGTITGLVTSENYPYDYFHNADCRWLVTAMDYQVVEFQFSDFKTELNSDYVTLYDGQETYHDELAKLSGQPSLSQVFTTSQRFMLIQFTSDTTTAYRGFSGSFRTEYPDTSSSNSLPGYAIALIVFGCVTAFIPMLIVLIRVCKSKFCGYNNAGGVSTPEFQLQAHKQANAAFSLAYTSSSNASNEFSVTDQDPLCSICMEKAQNAVLLPCRHGNYCIDCATRAYSTNPYCPTCRQTVDNIMQIYR